MEVFPFSFDVTVELSSLVYAAWRKVEGGHFARLPPDACVRKNEERKMRDAVLIALN